MEEKKKYYWLKLKEDFFRNKTIKKLRNIAGGDTYTLIYLKMQLLSLKNEGNLYFDEVEDTMADEIALEIDETPENVKVVLMYLVKNKMVEEVDGQTLSLVETKQCIGRETAVASRVRKHRELKKSDNKLLQCNTNETKCNTEKEIEKEIEKESVSVSEAENEKLNEILERHQIKSKNIRYQLKEYIKNKMEIDIINNALMIPYDRNVMHIFDGTYPDPEEYVPPIKDPLAYSMAILEKWNEFGVRDIEDVKKYNKLLKSKRD